MLIPSWAVNLGADSGSCLFCGGRAAFVPHEARKGSLPHGSELHYESERGAWRFFDFIPWVMPLEEEAAEARLRMGRCAEIV